MKTLDIILVSYNQEKYIQQAIDSILMQQLQDDVQVRIIVADDCSTDKTYPLICEQLGTTSATLASGHNVEIEYLPVGANLGISKNYKRAFAATKADYVAIIEGDDYWCSPNHLNNHINFLEEHRECVLSSNRMYIKNEIKDIYEQYYPQNNNIIYSGLEQARCNRIGNLTTCMFRGDLLLNVPSDMFELEVDDWLLGLQLCKFGYIGKLYVPTSVYRINKKSQWAAMTPQEQVSRNIDRIEKYDKFLDGIYHEAFMKLKAELLHGNDTKYGKLKKWFPPFLVSIAKYLIPPVFFK